MQNKDVIQQDKMVVPKDKGIRKEISNCAKNLVQTLGLVAPIQRDSLENSAQELISLLELDQSLLAYTMVIVGNEIWRPIYEATPYNRRLLLLPQCIRNKQHCTAKFDDFGLLCNSCQSCHIDPLLQEAERLGYASLVAEGTTVALSLATEGSIDAVLGVSCMPILERSFTKVSKVALPAFGIPLLNDGCQNTKIDIEWLTEELRAYTPSKNLEPISISLTKKLVDTAFKIERIEQILPSNYSIDTIARDYLCLGGGRMRPLLSMISYLSYSDKKDQNISEHLAILIECFHKASLIHDDIEDNATERYNQQPLHLRYDIPTAINVGDYLIGMGYQLLAGIDLSSEIKGKGLQVLASSHVRLTQGQSNDLEHCKDASKFSVDDVLEIFRLKTGEAIKSAILLGAVAGEAEQSELDFLSQFADALGVAYQIKDDLDEFANDNSKGKIENYPILTALLLKHANSAYILNDIIEYRIEIGRYDIVERAEQLLETSIQQANDSVTQLNHPIIRLNLHNLMAQIFGSSSERQSKIANR